jgi:hypothetical protein
MKKKLMALFLAVAVALTVIGPVAASGGNASVYVVHGIPGKDVNALLGTSLPDDLPVDVSVNGTCALQGFKFGEIVGPLSLPAGAYDIQVRVADPAHPCTGFLAIDVNDLPLNAGESATIVAHLNTAGAPTASKFVNDLSRTRRAEARLVVRHTANAPAVDICLFQRGRYLGSLDNLTNASLGMKGEAQIEVKRGRYEAGVFAAGTLDQVGSNIPVTLRPQTATFVFAVGSLANGTFTVIPQVINLR